MPSTSNGLRAKPFLRNSFADSYPSVSIRISFSPSPTFSIDNARVCENAFHVGYSITNGRILIGFLLLVGDTCVRRDSFKFFCWYFTIFGFTVDLHLLLFSRYRAIVRFLWHNFLTLLLGLESFATRHHHVLIYSLPVYWLSLHFGHGLHFFLIPVFHFFAVLRVPQP